MVEVYSAGTEPADDVHPLAKEMMAENGIDPSKHRPEKVDQYLGKEFDIVVTTCDGARESCPFFPGDAQRFHWGLDDPAAAEGDREKRLALFRSTFAELSERIAGLMEVVKSLYNKEILS
jgi:arsenate reductase